MEPFAMFAFPPLPIDGEPTRATLHAYAHAVATLPRAHAIAHPLWWHSSLKVRPDGLVTEENFTRHVTISLRTCMVTQFRSSPPAS